MVTLLMETRLARAQVIQPCSLSPTAQPKAAKEHRNSNRDQGETTKHPAHYSPCRGLLHCWCSAMIQGAVYGCCTCVFENRLQVRTAPRRRIAGAGSVVCGNWLGGDIWRCCSIIIEPPFQQRHVKNTQPVRPGVGGSKIVVEESSDADHLPISDCPASVG